MAGRERLRDERAVAVAVQVDVPRVQGAEHIGEVVGHGCRSVVVRGVAHLLRTVARGGDRVVALLQRAAAQRRRPARAAVVDEQEVAVVHDRREQREVRVARAGRREAGAAFDRDDRALGLRAHVGAGVQLDADRELVAVRMAAVERHVHRSAPRTGDVFARIERDRAEGDRRVGIEPAGRGGGRSVARRGRRAGVGHGDDGDLALVDDLAAPAQQERRESDGRGDSHTEDGTCVRVMARFASWTSRLSRSAR